MLYALAKTLQKTAYIKWISRHTTMPPNDQNYKVLVTFSNGGMALSDGKTVHDLQTISLWKPLVPMCECSKHSAQEFTNV
jgi:hypothetical protein